MSTISAIYVRMPNWIGDVCMTLPSLELLLDTGLPVVVCARPWARDLLEAYPLSGFVPMSGTWQHDRASVSAWRKKNHHTHARGLLLPDSLSSAMVFRFAGIRCAGHRDDGRSLILQWPIAKAKQAMHAVESWHRLSRLALKRWDILPASHGVPAFLKLPLSQHHTKDARALMHKASLKPNGFTLIAPTAVGLHRGRNKVWDGFDQLTRYLQRQGHTVVMCPPAAEAEQARRNAPTAVCLPPLGLGAFAALTRYASVVVCNDSGVSHIAAAARAHQVTLFGVTAPGRTGPWTDRATCLGSESSWPDLEQVIGALDVFFQQTELR